MRLFFFLFTIASSGLFAQSDDRFKNFHGLRGPNGAGRYFEAEGYDIFIQTAHNGLDEKGILKIRKQYSVKDAVLGIDSVLNMKTLTGTKDEKGVPALYCF